MSITPSSHIAVTKVLYEYDGPAIFVGKVGYFDSLFVRVKETDDGLGFLSAHTDDRIIEALLEGRLSVFGAIAQYPELYFVSTDHNLELKGERLVTLENISPDLLPEAGAGLFPRFGECPDVVQEKDAFVSVYFRGTALSRTQISLSVLRKLLQITHDFVKNALPDEMKGSRSATVDFPIADPALGSLMISVKTPVVEMNNIARREVYKVASKDFVEKSISDQKNRFIDGIGEMIEAANDTNTQRLMDSYASFEDMKDLLPTKDTAFSEVLITSSMLSDFKRIKINKKTSEIILKAFEMLDNTHVKDYGKIDEINTPSKSLLMKSYRGRTVTCYFSPETFERLETNQNFKNGMHIVVEGVFTRRPRRDKIIVAQVNYLGVYKAPK